MPKLAAIVLLSLLGAACTGSPPVVYDTADTDTDTDSDTDTDTDSDTDTDTDPVGTDNDGDSWTAEGGDCDDDDVFVNPSWDENASRANDGKDNDCDGRIDERFGGVTLLRAGSGSALVTVDTLGDKTGETALSTAVNASWSDENLSRDGWVMLDGGGGLIFDVKADGTVTQLFDFTTLDPETELPFGVWGVATNHADGNYVVSGVDRLFTLTDDGAGSWSLVQVADWVALAEDGSHDIAPVGITANRATGQVALFGFFGGVGFWDADDGFSLVTPGNAATPEVSLFDAQTRRADGHFVLGQDLLTGEYTIYRWNWSQSKLVARGTVPDPDFVPVAFAIEEESGDFYFTANPGQWRTVWRMVEDGTYATQLHPGGTDPLSWPADPNLDFLAVGITWE